jgi:hypothetical protein
MIKQLIDFCESEHVLLTCPDDDGDFNAYIKLPGGGYLEISHRIRNRPRLYVSAVDISESELAEHINEELRGMYVQEANLDGLHLDDDNCVHDPEMDEDDESLMPLPS